MHTTVSLLLLVLLLSLAACRAPTHDLSLEPGDFALLEIHLKG